MAPKHTPRILVAFGLLGLLFVAVGVYGQEVVYATETDTHLSTIAYLRGLMLFVGLAALVGTVKLTFKWRDGGLTASWAISTFLATVTVGFIAAAVAVEWFTGAGTRIAIVGVAAIGSERAWFLALQTWDRITSSDILRLLRGGDKA